MELTPTSENFNDIMLKYAEDFNKCGILKETIPRVLENEEQLSNISNNL